MKHCQTLQVCKSNLSWQQLGYFGKSSKPRELEPSMFQILTWNQVQLQPIKSVCNERKLPADISDKHEQIACQKDLDNTLCEEQTKDLAKDEKLINSKKNEKQNLKTRYYEKRERQSTKSLNKQHNYSYQNRQQSQEIRKSKVHKKQKNRFTDVIPQNISQQKALQKFRQTTRWLPNSSFTTYYGKPAFQNYGRGNLTPTNGGVLYGNYMKTHNVQPHRGDNFPKNQQSFSTALKKAQQMGPIKPFPPKSKAYKELSNNLSVQQIYPQENCYEQLEIVSPDLSKVEKFGGEGLKKLNRNHSKIR